MGRSAANGIVCLVGGSQSGRRVAVEAGALEEHLVQHNAVVFGTVNANRRHYESGLAALAAGDRAWLERLITRRVPVDRFADALDRRDDDVKVVLTFA